MRSCSRHDVIFKKLGVPALICRAQSDRALLYEFWLTAGKIGRHRNVSVAHSTRNGCPHRRCGQPAVLPCFSGALFAGLGRSVAELWRVPLADERRGLWPSATFVENPRSDRAGRLCSCGYLVCGGRVDVGSCRTHCAVGNCGFLGSDGRGCHAAALFS